MLIFHRSWRLVFIEAMAVLTLAACGDEDNRGYQGYVEGDYLYLSAPLAGYLEKLAVDRGSYLELGAPVFSISAEPEVYALAEAEAQDISAQQKIRNLKEPRRPDEIAALKAQLEALQAQLNYSEAQLRRMQALVKKGFISHEVLDDARKARDRDAAQVDAAREQLLLYRKALGREPEIRAAEADSAAAEYRVAQKRWQVGHKSVTAPAIGEISEIYYRPGEWVPAGQPVASFLPDRRRLIRFFVPEADVAGIRLGQRVAAECDGCPGPVMASVTFIAAQAEYTPPVIYSRDARTKLVFRVEASPVAEAVRALHPGQPLDVRLLSGEAS